MDKLKILVVDDHPIYAQGICRIMQDLPNVESCEESHNGADALERIKSKKFDLIFLDISMPIMDGIELSSILVKEFPELAIVILTSSDNKRQIVELLNLGVSGYVLKNTDKSELVAAMEQVLDGTLYLTKEIFDIYAKFLVYESKRSNVDNNEALSPREEEVVKLICQQCTTKEIAYKLNLSNTTVNNHRSNIMKKIKTDNVVGIVIYAVKMGYYIP